MGQTPKSATPGLGDADLLCGAKAISAFLGVTPRQGRGLIERGHLTTFNVGKIICARRSNLTAWLTAQEARAAHRPKRDAESDADRAA